MKSSETSTNYPVVRRQAWIARVVSALGIKQLCRICQLPSHQAVCPVCQQDLERYPLNSWHNNLLLHPDISANLNCKHIDSLVAIADYQWPLCQLITQLKFSRAIHLAPALASLFCEHIRQFDVATPDAILPLPLHNNRLAARGFNQAFEVARLVAAELQCPLILDRVIRHKSTKPQTDLSRAERQQNLREAFSLCGELDCEHLVVFDDVVTTGATTNALAGYLKQRYPDMQIEVWCLCITRAR